VKISNFLNEKIVIPLADRYMGTEIMKYYEMIKIMSAWTPEEIRNWQNERLRNLIDHVFNHTVYYRELFQKSGIHPSDIKDITDLKKLPVLKKEDIIHNSEKIRADNLADIKHKKVATGGSIGDPLRFLLDNRSFIYTTAMRYYYLGKLGYRLGDKLLVLGGSSVNPHQKFSYKYKIYHYLNRKIFLSGINMSDKVADRYLEILAKKKITHIYGYPSAIYLLASRAEKRNLKFPRLRGCVTTSEMLTQKYREKIKSAFECEVMDVYGAGDGSVSAFESEPGIYNVGYNCIIDIERNFSKDNTGSVLLTDLFNYASPFIRYQVGDQISLLDSEKAKKYYNGQIITKIWGRISDILKLENGNILTGPAFTILFSNLNVKTYRKKKIGYMHIGCDIETTGAYNKKEEILIINALKKHAGEECKVSINYVDEFQILPSGKRNYFISGAE
jgi:phenylacetate-CoA ligase